MRLREPVAQMPVLSLLEEELLTMLASLVT